MTQQLDKEAIDGSAQGRRICSCFDVTVGDIHRHMSQPNATVEELVRETGIGTKCTACLLDLDVVLSSYMSGGDAAEAALEHSNQDWRDIGPGLLVPKLFLDSGFFMQGEGFRTELVCANYGLLFKPHDAVVPHRFVLSIFGEDGRRTYRKKGRLEPNDNLRIDFSDIAGCPARGWFLFELKPLEFGLEGSVRPQFLIHGTNFSASVHTQPHWSACRSKSVMLTPQTESFAAGISLINAAKNENEVTLRLAVLDAGEQKETRTAALNLPPAGSALAMIDDYFAPADPGMSYLLFVTSNDPVRKHIVNFLSSGAWSIDHFPNAK